MGRNLRLVLIALLVLPIITGLPRGVSAAYTWTPPQQLTFHVGQAGLESSPSIAVDAQGKIWVVWEKMVSVFPENFEIYYKVFDGTSWSVGAPVTTSPAQDQHPAIARLPNGTMMVAWTSNRTGNFDIWYKNFNGVSWGPEIQLTNNPAPEGGPALLVTRNNNVWLAWHRQTVPGNWDLFAKVFNGVSWGPEQQLTTNTSSVNNNPRLRQAVDGRIWLVWNRSIPGGVKAENWYKIFNGASWSAETQFTGDSLLDFNPDVLQSKDGTIWFFWSKELPVVGGGGTLFEEQLFYKYSLDNGVIWTGETQFTADVNATNTLPTSVQGPDGRIWLAWGSNRPNATQIDTETWAIWLVQSNQLIVHDVAVTGVSGNRTVAYQGEVVRFSVSVSNLGDFAENPTVTLTANSSQVGSSQTVSIAARSTATLTFYWSTSGKNLGHYLLTGVATGVNETSPNLLDNSITIIEKVSPRADVNRDGVVDIIDAAIVATAFDSVPGMPNWNPVADINRDGRVDILDIANVGFYFGFKA